MYYSLDMVVDLPESIHDQRWNLEQFAIFQIVILQHSCKVKQAKDIRKRNSAQMDTWKEVRFTMLVQNTECALNT